MAYEGAFASLYFIFAVLFAIANVMTQEVGPRSDMYRTVQNVYTKTPYSNSPDKFWSDISTPADLYRFFKFVFVPATYVEQPSDGFSNGFCIDPLPCAIDQGDCDVDSQCSGPLTCRDSTAIAEGRVVNGNYWDTDELVTWCNYMGTPVDLSLTDQQCNPGASAIDTTGLGPCCWDENANSYITRIDTVTSDPAIAGEVQLRMNCPSSMDSTNDCCAMPTPLPLLPNITEARQTAGSASKFPAYVGNFNRLLFCRLTMKRYVLEQNNFKHFGGMVYDKIRGEGTNLSPGNDNGDFEDKQDIVMPDGSVIKWERKGSYAEAGGFAVNFPRNTDLKTWATFIEMLDLADFFDPRMATATIELLLYNGNIDNFMYITMGLQFDFAGTAVKMMTPAFINMQNQKMEDSYAIPRIIEKVLIGLVVFFFCVEVKLMVTMPNYFGKPAKIVDLLSLALCTTVLVLNYVISENSTFKDFDFDALLLDPEDTVVEVMRQLVDLLSLNSIQAIMVAINMLMIFVRAVMLVTQLEGQLGLIIDTLATAASRLGFFFFQYMLLLLGFVAFAYFTFGTAEESGMSDFPMTFYIVFAMLVGLSKREDLAAADPTITPIFIIIYYVVTVFVMQNMFVSILLSGYDQVWHDLKKRQDKNGKDMNFMLRILTDYLQAFQTFRRVFAKCISVVWFNCLKYIWDGLTSCFWECLAACDCGCPNPFKACANCIRACRRPKKELRVSQDMLFKEFEETKKQVRKADKWAIQVKDDPGESQSLKEKRKVADDARRDAEPHVEEAKKTGVPIPDPDLIAEYYLKLRSSRFELKGLIAEQKKKESLTELLIMAIFLSTFIGMMILLVSMGDVFVLQESSLQPALERSWDSPGTLKTTKFEGIQSFEDVGLWAITSMLSLYNRPECRTYPQTPGASSDIQYCNNAANNQQIVNKINKWNIGFLNTTFVRVTIQPACFIRNPEDRWSKGYELLRSKSEDGQCSSRACYDAALKEEGTCLDSFGETIDVSSTYVLNSVGTSFEIPYNYSVPGKLGPFQLTGGFTVSLGTTPQECITMLAYLSDDRWFTKNSVSMVFDWVTYNGNVDYFAYNYVRFNLEPTGKLSSSFKTFGVPINFERGGNWNATRRIVTLVLLAMYGLFVMFFLTKVLRALNAERLTRKAAGEGGLKFVVAYYKSFWNCADTMSQILSIVSLWNLIEYLLLPFRNEYKFSVNALDKYAIPNAAVQEYEMLKDTDPSRVLQDDWYIFLSFETLASKFSMFLSIAALNSFFISIRVVKHVNQNSAFKVYSGTLSSGLIRQAYFFFVILLLMAGWALFFMILFGNVDERLSGLLQSFESLFMWILGNFFMGNMLAENKPIAIVSFIFYQILMNFVAINMFLATMLNTYAGTVGQNEIDKELEKVRKEHETLYTMVEYKDKQAFKNDIRAIDVDGETRDVYVKTRSKDGLADKNNIRDGGIPGGGHQIYKVNGARDKWNQYDTIQEIYDLGIAEDDRDHMVRIIFKESEPEKKGCSEFFGQLFAGDEKESTMQDIKPTVKGFWRKFGAVTQINIQMTKQLQLSKEDELGGDDGDADLAGEKGEGDDDDKNANFDKALKARVKRRLDTLLFSRATKDPSQDDAIDPFDEADKEQESYKDPDDVKDESELPIDDIRDIIETESIQGWEVWLDCLISSIENEPEMEDECLVTEVLRTAEMQDMNKNQRQRSGDVLMTFYGHASDVLSELEFKAKRKYYERLKVESSERYKMFESQNQVLHDYACELEVEFTRIMENIHKYRHKKDVMRTKLAGLLDKEGYKHLDTSGEPENKSHMSRFSIPWQGSAPALSAGNETQI